jgi:DNA-binding CsgD family transcriptional regulator
MVAATTPAPVRRLFDGLVPPELLNAYEHLLATGGCAKTDAPAELGGPAIVQALTDTGMAHIVPHTPADPAWLRPATPDLALLGVLGGHQTRLARDQELLLNGHRRLAEAQASYPTPMTATFPEHLVAVISNPAQISDLSTSLRNTARRDWMSLDTLTADMPLTDDHATGPLPATAGQVRCRSIYPAAAMDDPAARRIITRTASPGTQTRLLPNIPMRLKLADHTTALLPLTPSGTTTALLIRAPVVLAALRDYFDLLWERATPLTAPPPAGPRADRLPPAQQHILELMAEGLPDAAIARRAQISITTVRRHITAIMHRLGAESRFAAGAAAHRRDWIS